MLSDLKFLPKDHSRQITIEYYFGKAFLDIANKKEYKILDLGCGEGASLNYFKGINNFIDWYGVDIENSPEVNNRVDTNERFITFDGINIPFPDEYFDLIYCHQVLEHVRFPAALIKEVCRVMKKQGYFLGSTSHLEPFHSLSYWNFTPFGFGELMKENNLKVVEIRPSIDALTLIIARILSNRWILKVFFNHESPLNFLIQLGGKLLGKTNEVTNYAKLMFCGQFVFFVKKEMPQTTLDQLGSK
jgi:SAM-dependent methyltransferase